MQQGHTLIVKFHSFSDISCQTGHLRKLLGNHGIVDADQLFPDETEGDLACLYTVNLAREAKIEAAINSLMTDKKIEYAHVPQERRLV